MGILSAFGKSTAPLFLTPTLVNLASQAVNAKSVWPISCLGPLAASAMSAARTSTRSPSGSCQARPHRLPTRICLQYNNAPWCTMAGHTSPDSRVYSLRVLCRAMSRRCVQDREIKLDDTAKAKSRGSGVGHHGNRITPGGGVSLHTFEDKQRLGLSLLRNALERDLHHVP
ncbi:hypothetical protein CC85DRAFT_287265 [Cutaneotrichosporon oleaginosum]|uniref:Uncharacterized protein n=1 Tax=Cutaneotrichosporon oleaginosum TaxID=879819 RepID=A0A0J0XI17_9TREE|nr:uncharacterized protein CC85DRAFT_287265 [Cutaneotrichosporon oleaginosum]KLT40652.1 hypothetical protein CC85DRAFT_287265 [Cutaneotrichosporon oleaginosum]